MNNTGALVWSTMSAISSPFWRGLPPGQGYDMRKDRGCNAAIFNSYLFCGIFGKWNACKKWIQFGWLTWPVKKFCSALRLGSQLCCEVKHPQMRFETFGWHLKAFRRYSLVGIPAWFTLYGCKYLPIGTFKLTSLHIKSMCWEYWTKYWSTT